MPAPTASRGTVEPKQAIEAEKSTVDYSAASGNIAIGCVD